MTAARRRDLHVPVDPGRRADDALRLGEFVLYLMQRLEFECPRGQTLLDVLQDTRAFWRSVPLRRERKLVSQSPTPGAGPLSMMHNRTPDSGVRTVPVACLEVGKPPHLATHQLGPAS